MPLSENDPERSPGADGTGAVEGDHAPDRAQPSPVSQLILRNAEIGRLTMRARHLRNELIWYKEAATGVGYTKRARNAIAAELRAVEEKLFRLMQMPLFPGRANDH